MPAPAVIPAPRAYINAVAVKGFVVELRPVKQTTKSHPPKRGRRPLLLQAVNKLRNESAETTNTVFLPWGPSSYARATHAWGDVRDSYCD